MALVTFFAVPFPRLRWFRREPLEMALIATGSLAGHRVADHTLASKVKSIKAHVADRAVAVYALIFPSEEPEPPTACCAFLSIFSRHRDFPLAYLRMSGLETTKQILQEAHKALVCIGVACIQSAFADALQRWRRARYRRAHDSHIPQFGLLSAAPDKSDLDYSVGRPRQPVDVSAITVSHGMFSFVFTVMRCTPAWEAHSFCHCLVSPQGGAAGWGHRVAFSTLFLSAASGGRRSPPTTQDSCQHRGRPDPDPNPEPVPAHRSPAPASGHRPPATGHRPPATGHRPPAPPPKGGYLTTLKNRPNRIDLNHSATPSGDQPPYAGSRDHHTMSARPLTLS